VSSEKPSRRTGSATSTCRLRGRERPAPGRPAYRAARGARDEPGISSVSRREQRPVRAGSPRRRYSRGPGRRGQPGTWPLPRRATSVITGSEPTSPLGWLPAGQYTQQNTEHRRRGSTTG